MTFQSIPLFCNFLCKQENYAKVPRIIFSHGQFMRELEKYIGAHQITNGCTLTARYIFLGIPKAVNALLVSSNWLDQSNKLAQDICGQTYTNTYTSMKTKKKRSPCPATPDEGDTWNTREE